MQAHEEIELKLNNEVEKSQELMEENKLKKQDLEEQMTMNKKVKMKFNNQLKKFQDLKQSSDKKVKKCVKETKKLKRQVKAFEVEKETVRQESYKSLSDVQNSKEELEN